MAMRPVDPPAVADQAGGPAARATLTDVARLAGVSAKTVSRVVSGDAKVAPATRERVELAARRLRFRPNTLARSLRHGGRTDTVAFVIGDLTNPFYIQVAAGVERELATRGMTMLLAATDDEPGSESRVVETMLRQQVRALLVTPIAPDQSYLEGERQLGTAIVCVDRPAHNLLADSVVLANRAGAAEATRALLAAGHRRIGLVVSPAELYTHAERLAGYREAMREAGVVDTTRWERLEPVGGPGAEESARDLLASDDPPTAIIAGNNRASAGVIRGIGDRRGRVAFVGFDDFDLADAFGISVVAYDPTEIGRAAARLALARLGDPTGPPQQVVIPTRLVARGSGEVPPPD